MTRLTIIKEEKPNYNSNKDDINIIFSIDIPEDRSSVLEIIKTVSEKIIELAPGVPK